MAVGVVFGVALGQQSRWLEHDLILMNDTSSVTLLEAPGGAGLGIALPKLRKDKPVLRLEVLGTRSVEDRLYYDVQLTVSKKLAIADAEGRLKSGQRIRGWVDAATVRRPISSIGDLVIGFVAPLGRMFLRLIKMVIVPLVFASLLVGVASLGDPRKLGRLGGKTLGYFLLTTTLAIGIGLALANVIKPGDFVSADDKAELDKQYGAAAKGKTGKAAEQPSAIDNLLGIIPTNPIKSMASGEMLQIIFFATFFGIALTLLPRSRAAPVLRGFEAINDAMVKLWRSS